MINRFAGRCGSCNSSVAAGAGQAVKQYGRWQTYHNECAPQKVPPPIGEHLGWHRLPMAAFDVETTSADPFEARIISAAIVLPDGNSRTWLINPRVPIPPDATERNGITDEMVRSRGLPAGSALGEIATFISKQIADGNPIAAFCASYDVTALHQELLRHSLPGVNWADALMIDPSVLHQHVEPEWFAPRTLSDLCRYYEVDLTHAHDALSDARATLELARSLAARHRRLAEMPLQDLHRNQIRWHRDQATDLQRYFDSRGISKTVHTEWPLEVRRRG